MTYRNIAPPRTWNDLFDALTMFKQKYGHTNVPEDYPEDPTLGKWTAFQRKNRQNLHKRQKNNLASIGFEFAGSQTKTSDRFRGEWDDMYNQLVFYINKNCNGKWPKMVRGNPPLVGFLLLLLFFF